jgi:hypothetical protein
MREKHDEPMDDQNLIPRSAQDGLGFELLAASLRADETDARAFLAALATKLEGALPAQTHVERARDGLFKGTTHVARITVELGGFRYTLSAGKRGGLEASRAKVVGGVVIKTEGLGVEMWIDALARDLAAYAESSASARAALERLVM